MESPPRLLVHGQPQPILIGLPAQAADLSNSKMVEPGRGREIITLGLGLPRISPNVVCCLRCKELLIWILTPALAQCIQP